MNAGETEGRAEFLVSEAGPKPESAKAGRPVPWRLDDQFPFELFFVARGRDGGDWRLRGDYRSRGTGRDEARASGRLDSEPQETSAAAEIVVGGIKEGVSFEDAAAAAGAEAADFVDKPGEIVDAELDFRFAVAWAGGGHGGL